MVSMIQQQSFAAAVLEHGWADEAELARLAEALPAWAEHPAAYVAVLKCSAVGWVPTN
jgi:hypothetical protein